MSLYKFVYNGFNIPVRMSASNQIHY